MSERSVCLMEDPVIHGGDVYRNKVKLDLSVSLNPYPVPEEVRGAAMQGLLRMHQYPDPSHERLRGEIARLEGVLPEQVIPGNGASELLMAVVHAAQPETALLPAPCYAGYEIALRASGCEIREYPLEESRDFLLGDDYLEVLTPDLDIAFLTDPNNPTGRRIDGTLLDRIIRRCQVNNILLVLDETFLPLTEEAGPASLTEPGVIHIRAFTKVFAVPGLRIGYLICGEDRLLRKIRLHLPEWNLSTAAEDAGTAAAKVLAETDFLARSLCMIRKEREYLTEEFRALGLRVCPGDANYLLVQADPELPDRLLERGILVRKCGNFHGLTDSWMRIAVRDHDENKVLTDILKEIIL